MKKPKRSILPFALLLLLLIAFALSVVYRRTPPPELPTVLIPAPTMTASPTPVIVPVATHTPSPTPQIITATAIIGVTIVPAPSATPVPTEFAALDVGLANVRECPSTSCRSLGYLAEGQTVPAGKCALAAETYPWIPVPAGSYTAWVLPAQAGYTYAPLFYPSPCR